MAFTRPPQIRGVGRATGLGVGVAVGAEEAMKHTNVRICYGFFRTGFRYSDRRRYSGFLSRDLGIISLILMGSPDSLSTLLHAG